MTGRPATRARTRWAAAIVGCALLASLAVPPAQQTEAFWTDSETAAATFTALKVPRPDSGGACVITGSLLNLLGSTLTLKWRLPPGVDLSAVRITYTGANGLVPVVDTLLGTNLKTTESGGVYSTTLTGSLLNAALGATRTLSVQVQDPSGWVSETRAVIGTWPLLGLGSPSCVDQ